MVKGGLPLAAVFGTAERFFVNPGLGCSAGCSYCYISKFGFPKFTLPEAIPAPQLINLVIKHPLWKAGETVISVGCYCDPFDSSLAETTLDFCEKIAKYQSPIQIATKQNISVAGVARLHSIFELTRLVIYISMPITINSEKHEPLTASIESRIKNIHSLTKHGIATVLYIKPVINSKTIKGIEIYENILLKYKIPAVIGPLFTSKNGKTPAPIDPSGELFQYYSTDLQKITTRLQRLTTVVSHSMELI